MKINKLALLMAMVFTLVMTVDDCQNSIWDDPYLIPVRKGLTYTATEWPSR